MNANFRWIAAGRAIDSLGNAMHPIALGFAVLSLFDSVAALGLVVGSASLGLVLFLLVGGIVADRLPRTVVLVASNFAAAALQFAVVGMFVADVELLPLLSLLSFLTGAAAAFDGPASTALVPQVLTPSELHRGNSLLLLLRRGGMLTGASTAGLVVALFGPEVALAVNAASFAAAGACFWRVRLPAVVDRPPSRSPLEDLAEGWSEFRSRTWVWVVVASFFVLNACWVGGFTVLGISVAESTFGPTAWGLIIGAEGIGAIVGGLVIARTPPARHPMRLGMVGAVLGVLPLAMLAVSSGPWVLGVSSVVGGVGMMVFSIVWETSLQQHIPTAKLARVSSIDSVGSFAAIPVGSFIVGPLAEAFGTLPVVRGATAISFVACAAALSSRSVRDLTQPVAAGG